MRKDGGTWKVGVQGPRTVAPLYHMLFQTCRSTTQAHFLIGCGLGEFVADVSGLDVVSRVNLSLQVMVLTLPGEMGERFKAIALVKGYDSPLRGFAVRDLRHTL